MEHRDLIKDEIEQLSKVLGKILSDLLGLKSNGQIEQGISITNSQLKTNLNIDIEDLLTLSKDEMKKQLVEQKMAVGHFEILAKYLKEIGESKMSNDGITAKSFLTRSLELLDLEDEVSNTLSFERYGLKSKIETMLQHCGRNDNQ
ncbi:MAG: hypothetical protein ACI8QD_001506 [Cyclobacteriaceae bacterium]|jgi:hypothetical protein